MTAIRYRDGLPVAPGAWPVVGHLPRAFRAMPELIGEARERLGQVFWISVLGNWVLVCTGEGAAELLKSPSFSSAHLPEVSPVVAGESLLSHDGPSHRRMRSAMSKPLSPRGLAAAGVGATSKSAIERLVNGWVERRRARVLPEVQEVALEIIFRMLGVRTTELPSWRRRYRELLLANLGAKSTFPGSPGWLAARAKAWIDERFAALVDTARAGGGDQGLLRSLALAEDDAGGRLGDRELVDNLRLLTLGGHETISSTLAWITIVLASRSDLWQALAAEAAEAKDEVPATLEQARSFPLVEAVFREVVRFHPPFGAITRSADEDTVFAGQSIPKGTVVAVDLWTASRDPAVFPSPDAFDPRRWLARSPPSQLEIVQFGMGPHFCIGYHLAWLEAVQFTVSIVRAAERRKLRPRLIGRDPKPVYLPTEHPPASTRVAFA